ncbi:MAG: Uma2 family endonuclease [Actinomycetota bacterium]
MEAVRPYRFTVEEYERLGEAGIIGEDERVELIDGQVVQMTPIGLPHTGTVKALINTFSSRLADRVVLSVQDPVVLDDYTEPQPDVVLLAPPLETYRKRQPRADDVLLLVEVADSSGIYDRGVKVPLYASAGIPEYWIVDVKAGVIEVHRSPQGDQYSSVEVVRPGGHVSPEAFPDIQLDVSAILGTSMKGLLKGSGSVAELEAEHRREIERGK